MNARERYVKNSDRAHRPRDQETRKQVPEVEEEGHHNGSNLSARSQSHKHHPKHGEVGECHEDEVVEI